MTRIPFSILIAFLLLLTVRCEDTNEEEVRFEALDTSLRLSFNGQSISLDQEELSIGLGRRFSASIPGREVGYTETNFSNFTEAGTLISQVELGFMTALPNISREQRSLDIFRFEKAVVQSTSNGLPFIFPSSLPEDDIEEYDEAEIGTIAVFIRITLDDGTVFTSYPDIPSQQDNSAFFDIVDYEMLPHVIIEHSASIDYIFEANFNVRLFNEQDPQISRIFSGSMRAPILTLLI